MLKAHPRTYCPVPESSTPLRDYPAWFFVKSNEQRPELVRIMRRIRLRTWFGGMSNSIGAAFETTMNGIVTIVGFIVILAFTGVVVYFGFRLFQGLAGLLEFGRRQL